MNESTRRLILRANAVWLGGAAAASLFLLDIPAVFFGKGTEAQIITAAPHAGAAFIEAHGFAVILAVVLWRARSTRDSHLVAAAAMTLMGTCNLIFWSIFAVLGSLAVGYVTTSIHWIMALAQFGCAFASSSDSRAVRLAD